MRIFRRFIGLSLITLTLAPVIQAAQAPSFIVEDGKANAEIVVSENSPRMTKFAALELQFYLEKMSGAKLPIVFEKTDTANIKIYVGKSRYTDEIGIDDKDLYYGAFRMVSGKDYLVLLGYDRDYRPKTTKVSWDKDTEEFINVNNLRITKNGQKRLNRHQREQWWGARRHKGSYEDFMKRRYGNENRKVWNPKNINKKRAGYFELEKLGFVPRFFMADKSGSLNAVAAFLRSLGARWYMPTEIGEVIPEVKTIEVPQVNKTEKPDNGVRFWRWPNYGAMYFEHIMWARRIGMNTPPYRKLGSGFAHGLVQVHKSKDMQEKHPEYYALGKDGNRITKYRGYGHVCFSSEGFYQTTLKYVRFMFDVNDAPHVSLWPCDGYKHCQCENCKKLSSSDLVWSFVDRVAREFYKTHPDRIISCGAYTPYIYPPSNVEKFTPNVAVFIANAGRALFDDPVHWNKYKTRVEDWKKKLAEKRIMRGENNYLHNAKNNHFPVIHPRNIAKDLKYLNDFCMVEMGGRRHKEGRFVAPGCDHLTFYVNARFLWDADQNIEEVLAEYYEKFYGPAAKDMREALEFAQAKYSRIDKTRPGGRCNSKNVPLPTRIKLLELLHKAKKAAGDTIYGQRIDLLISELPDLEKSREELKVLQEKGDPRDDAPVIEAYNLKDTENIKIYKLLRTTLRRKKPDLDTTFKIKWSEKSLTFDIRCEEPDMKSIKVGEQVWEGDSVVLLLESPYHSYYQIEVDTEGRIFDADREGFVVPQWYSMADVKIEKGKDYWNAKITLPIAILGEEGAEGDPMNYVVASRIKPGQEWFFNIARRRPREGSRHSLRKTYVLRAGGGGGRNMLARDCFAKLVIK